jgi:hypothetical protein
MTNDPEDANDAGTYAGPVLFYNETVLAHFANPRNVGKLSRRDTAGSHWLAIHRAAIK